MTGANIARAMQLSPPTVHEMVGRLERDGYITRGADKVDRVHRHRPRARRGDRPPPPADRALPHRRPRHPVGRGPRGGRAARARDVARARGADARRDRRRQDLPARPPDRRRQPDRERAAGRRRGRRQGHDPPLRERGRGPPALPQGRRAGPGAAGHARGQCGDDEVVFEPAPTARAARSRAASPRPCRSSPTRRRRRASRCPGQLVLGGSATAARAFCELAALPRLRSPRRRCASTRLPRAAARTCAPSRRPSCGR